MRACVEVSGAMCVGAGACDRVAPACWCVGVGVGVCAVVCAWLCARGMPGIMCAFAHECASQGGWVDGWMGRWVDGCGCVRVGLSG